MIALVIANLVLRVVQVSASDHRDALWWAFELTRWGIILAIVVVARGLWMDLARRLDQVIETVYAAKR